MRTCRFRLAGRESYGVVEGTTVRALNAAPWAGGLPEGKVVPLADVQLLVPRLVYPVVEEVYREFFSRVHAGLVVEQSHQGQLYRILRMFLDIPAGLRSFCRSGANPFQPSEVVARLREATLALQLRPGDARQPQE